MKSKKQLAIQLAEYIHQEALKDDLIHKKSCIQNNKATQAEGESGMVFHTRNLLNLLKELKPDDCNS
tara:strand:+ start:294 stop:494 length:201 start_codon:yes stop_codon:yes gene_type:complete